MEILWQRVGENSPSFIKDNQNEYLTFQTIKAKESKMAKLICYCWGYTDEDIRKDVLEHNGRSTIMEKIKELKKAGKCQCETKNPKGK